jgi:hypothetical protein
LTSKHSVFVPSEKIRVSEQLVITTLYYVAVTDHFIGASRYAVLFSYKLIFVANYTISVTLD